MNSKPQEVLNYLCMLFSIALLQVNSVWTFQRMAQAAFRT